MENFKLASKHKLRIQTSKGLLSVEQLWDLSLTELDTLAVSLETEKDKSVRKSFLAKTTVKDKIAALRFDVVLDILNTKMEESEAARKAQETKESNQEILALIAEKKGEEKKKLSIEELEALLVK